MLFTVSVTLTLTVILKVTLTVTLTETVAVQYLLLRQCSLSKSLTSFPFAHYNIC